MMGAVAGCLLLLSGQALALDAKKLKPDQIRISYQEPKNPQHREIAALMKQRQVLEKIRDILGVIRLPHWLLLELRDCDGEENAWYDPGEYTVTVCYELLQRNWNSRPKQTTPVGITPEDAFLGPVAEIFMHESGHAIFDLLEVPVFGHEEDAADQIAAYIILKTGPKIVRHVIGGIAYMYGHDALAAEGDTDLGQYADEHGHPAQRYFTYLCMAYGKDPKMFADVIDKGRLPKSRAERCEDEYLQIDFAFKKTITPYIDQKEIVRIRSKAWLKEKLK
jgi:hypothetical protein